MLQTTAVLPEAIGRPSEALVNEMIAIFYTAQSWLSPSTWAWQTSDRLAAVALLMSVAAGLYAFYSKRKERRETLSENAPNVVVTFRRVAERSPRRAAEYLEEHIIPTLHNIGPSPAVDVECVFVPWQAESEGAARFMAPDISIAYLTAGEKTAIAKHRAICAEWDTSARTCEDLPFAIFAYQVAYSDRTHRYAIAYCVSLFGFPDQIRGDTENDVAMPMGERTAVPLNRLRLRDRLFRIWEAFAQPIRRRRYQRLMKRKQVEREQAQEPPSH